MNAQRAGAWLDEHGPTIAAVVGPVLLAAPPIWTDKGNAFELWLMIALMVLGAACAAFSPIVLSRRANSAEDIQADRDLVYTRYLGPLLAKLRDVVEASPEEVEAKYLVFTTSVCSDAAGMVVRKEASDPARVNYYRLRGTRAGQEFLENVHKTRTVRRPRLDRKTKEGRLILERTLRGEPGYCPVVSDADPSQVDPDESHPYACYASVSVTLDNTVYGMLSANALTSEDIPESSMPILELFASLLAVAEARLGVVDARPVIQ